MANTDLQNEGAKGATIAAGDDSDASVWFVEQMGLLCESDNLPRIAGRLFGLLILEDEAFSLRELADRLQVSRASVSTNARILTEMGLAERVARPGNRQDYYRLAGNPFEQTLIGKVRDLKKAQDFYAEAAERIPAGWTTARKRLRGLAAFHREAVETVTALIERSTLNRN